MNQARTDDGTRAEDTAIDLPDGPLGATERSALSGLVAGVRGALGASLVSVGLYGSAARQDYLPERSDINVLVVAERLDVADLSALRGPVMDGRAHGISPLLVTVRDLDDMASAFPIKAMSIREDHVVLWGKDALAPLEVDPGRVQARGRQELFNLLLRLRAHYLATGGHRLTEVMAGTSRGFLENLRGLLGVGTGRMAPREGLAQRASERLGIDRAVLDRLAALRGAEASLPQAEAEELFSGYMGAIGAALHAVDDMEGRR